MTDGNYDFEATNEDGSPRKFVGMHRPPFEQFLGSGYLQCHCGMVLQTAGQTRDHWLQGHLDRALYEIPQPEGVQA